MEKFSNFGWETDANHGSFVDRYPSVEKNINTDWLIIGGGLTGFSAVNQLHKYNINERITLLDAGRIGQGSSSRNSGFLVDSTLNNGATSISDLKLYKKKYALNLAGMSELKAIVDEFDIQCDWSKSGKYHAASNKKEFYKLYNFSNLLSSAGIEFNEYNQGELFKLLGTKFYNYAIKTKGGVLLNPKKLIYGFIERVSKKINIYENTNIIKIVNGNIPFVITSDGFKVNAKKIIIAVNSELPNLNIKKRFSFPLILTSSITRRLTSNECNLIGNPAPWGVLSVKPTGATVRFTNDHRIMIRNTSNPYFKSLYNFDDCIKKHRDGLSKRFPEIKHVDFDNSWSGMISVSRNGNPLFGNIDRKIFYGGVYNGGGLGLSALFGAAMIDSALTKNNSRLNIVESYPEANVLPPFPKAAAFIRIKYDQLFGSNET